MENFFEVCLCYYSLCRRRNYHFDVNFGRIDRYLFLSKDGGMDAVHDGKDERKGVHFPPESAFFLL